MFPLRDVVRAARRRRVRRRARRAEPTATRRVGAESLRRPALRLIDSARLTGPPGSPSVGQVRRSILGGQPRCRLVSTRTSTSMATPARRWSSTGTSSGVTWSSIPSGSSGTPTLGRRQDDARAARDRARLHADGVGRPPGSEPRPGTNISISLSGTTPTSSAATGQAVRWRHGHDAAREADVGRRVRHVRRPFRPRLDGQHRRVASFLTSDRRQGPDRTPASAPPSTVECMITRNDLESLSSHQLHDRAVDMGKAEGDIDWLWGLLRGACSARSPLRRGSSASSTTPDSTSPTSSARSTATSALTARRRTRFVRGTSLPARSPLARGSGLGVRGGRRSPFFAHARSIGDPLPSRPPPHRDEAACRTLKRRAAPPGS